MSTCSFVTIRDLTKKYKIGQTNQEIEALKQINLTIYNRDIFGIIGESGSGKTTLLRCLSGLESITSGTIEFTNASYKKPGMIFQHFNLFNSKTVFQNIIFPLALKKGNKKDILSKGEELLQMVGLIDKKNVYPSQLSGGQKQKVAIARALATCPEILLCDEATSSLDPLGTQAILQLLLELNRKFGLTIILITHQMEVIKQICNRAAILEKGEIKESGPVGDLFCSPVHACTKRFLSRDVPSHLIQTELLRLCFRGEEAKKPIITEMLSKYDISVNILHGGIDCLQQEIIGNLVVEMTGDSEEKKNALFFLREKGVIFEVIKPCL